MRAISQVLAARIAGGATTLAQVWRIARRDGALYGFTDHDRPLLFDALICEPVQGLSAGAIEKSVGLGVDTASMSGVLSSDAITEADLSRGLWDGALVDVYRVDWSDTSLRIHLFSGRIGEVRRGTSAFQAELRGLQAPLNTPVGRVFSRYCDANLGDSRCGKDIGTAAYRGAGIVTEVLGPAALRADGLEAFTEGWFTRGKMIWSAGGESEVASHRIGGGDAILELTDAPYERLVAGAGFTVSAGCDKRFETCREKFSNALNFRGCPHMPGNDAVQAGPGTGQPMDGGSRLA